MTGLPARTAKAPFRPMSGVRQAAKQPIKPPVVTQAPVSATLIAASDESPTVTFRNVESLTAFSRSDSVLGAMFETIVSDPTATVDFKNVPWQNHSVGVVTVTPVVSEQFLKEFKNADWKYSEAGIVASAISAGNVDDPASKRSFRRFRKQKKALKTFK